jgi:uncharacterized membrane-anchored protein YhcB (DUF1043 family)
MPSPKPRTPAELFKFYHDHVKPLYSAIQVENVLPNEVLFELNAALDHLSRSYVYGDTEEDCVGKAYSHMKRACLDIFKLKVKDAIDQYKELKKLNTHFIDNGEFDKNLNQLHIQIKHGATTARRSEGDTRDDDQAIIAFSLWQPVYADCVRMEEEFYHNKNIDWSHRIAKRLEARQKWIERIWGFIIGVVTGLLVWWLTERWFPQHLPSEQQSQTAPSTITPSTSTAP